jgi:hypothetical protein
MVVVRESVSHVFPPGDDSRRQPKQIYSIDFRTILGDLNRLYASTQDIDQKLNYDSGTTAHPPGQDCNRHIIAIASNIGAVIIPGLPPLISDS